MKWAQPCLIITICVVVLRLQVDESKAAQGQRETPAKGSVSAEAKKLFKEVASIYENLKAYGDEGKVSITVSLGGQPTRKVRQMPLLFVRPNRFSVDYGTLQMGSDGKSLVVVDATHRTVFERPITKAGLTTNTFELDEDERTSGAQLLFYREKVLGTGSKKDVSQTLGTVGAQMNAVILSLLIDRDPAKLFAKTADSIEIERRDGGMRGLRIKYPDTTELRLVLDPDSKLVQRIEMEIPDALKGAVTPDGKQLVELKIAWESGAIDRDSKTVGRRLDDTLKAMKDSIADDFNRINPMAIPPKYRAPIPVPPGGSTFIERIRNLIRGLFGL